jgi:tRNA threonylcarbamoyladenosine biosynthesis protein TsaE
MKKLEILSKSGRQTKIFARDLAKELKKFVPRKTGKATVIGISGDLGAGKTTFVQGFAKALGVKERITSPTFVIMKKFPIHKHKIKNSFFSFFYHFDFYRLSSAKDLQALDFRKIAADPKNLVVVEWSDRIKNFNRNVSIRIDVGHGKKNERIIKMTAK